MCMKYVPLTILLVAFSSHMQMVRASNGLLERSIALTAQLNYKQKPFQEVFKNIRNRCNEALNSSSENSLIELSGELIAYQSNNLLFELEMQRAHTLVICKAPKKAQKILQGILPETDSQKREWALLSWQASNASMDHQNASLALRSLSAGVLQNLDQEEITVGYRSDGSSLTRSALDLLAEHERLNGRCEAAAKVLLAGRRSGALGAVRMSRASQCLEGLNVERRRDLLELALYEANADKAWWLVGDILRLRIMLDLASGGDAKVLKQDLEKYAKQLDDRYTQWELIRSDIRREEERILLENQLRSSMKYAPDQ